MKKNVENKIALYTNDDGSVELRADVEGDTLWATQAQIAQVFQVNSQAITKHIKNIYFDGELVKDSTCSKMEQVQIEGGRQIARMIDFYNLDIIIAVGYRVNSKKATQFRIWATQVLRNYLIKGYSLNQQAIIGSAESLQGLDEAIALMKSKEYPGKLKGKIDIRVTKHLEP
jgi:hypothetical protein